MQLTHNLVKQTVPLTDWSEYFQESFQLLYLCVIFQAVPEESLPAVGPGEKTQPGVTDSSAIPRRHGQQHGRYQVYGGGGGGWYNGPCILTPTSM